MRFGRVALVEDDEGLRRAIERLLTASGHEVATFESAEALLASGDFAEVACLILDVRLPGLSGFELRERLDALDCHPPVIYVTAFDDPATHRRAEREGAPCFLKPVPGSVLLGAVRAALGEVPK